jgi:hypothetical protein
MAIRTIGMISDLLLDNRRGTLQRARTSEGTRVHARTRPGIAVRQPRFTARLKVPAKWAESHQAGDPFTNCEPVKRCTRFVPEPALAVACTGETPCK